MTKLQPVYDFVIVGSGGGAICAALVAQKAGMSTVIIEKSDKVGGSTSYSGGVMWVPDNPVMARNDLEDSAELARTYLDSTVTHDGPASNAKRKAAFLAAGPSMVAFLEQQGMRFRIADHPDYYDELPGGRAGGRSLMAENFNLFRLGDWRKRLATYAPVRGLPFGLDQVAKLTLLKRTGAAKRFAVKFGLGLLLNKLVPGREVVSNGPALQGRMLRIALRKGIAIVTGAPVEDMIVEDGKVVGVVTQFQGVRAEVRASHGVLLNAGGFAKNAELRKRYQRSPSSTDWSAANPGDTGEVMQAAIALGAATDCLDAAWWIATSKNLNGDWPGGSVLPDGTISRPAHHLDLSLPHVILVTQDGRRVANESGCYVEIGDRIFQRQHETGRAVPCWAIFDKRHRERYPWAGLPPGVTPDDWIASGYMKKADTLDELARICDIDPAGLKDEVARFNGFTRSGIDLDFSRGGRRFDRSHGDPTVKPNPCLGAIERGPFFACAIYPGDGGTSGGLVTNEHGQVLRDDGSVISGLYATGNITASVFGYAYPGAGASISAAFAFGFVAANHACRPDNP